MRVYVRCDGGAKSAAGAIIINYVINQYSERRLVLNNNIMINISYNIIYIILSLYMILNFSIRVYK